MIASSAPALSADPPVVECPSLKTVLEEARRAAKTSRAVLVTGESGSGKSLVARAIHDPGSRPDRPFVTWSAPQASETLGLGELFGHVRGSFTGADRDGVGMIEAAHGGTLLIDDVDKLSLKIQGILLRFLDSSTIHRVGSNEMIRVDVRLIFTINRPLGELVRENLFLPDLAWRLRGLRIHVPPLRERPDDVTALILHFAERFAAINERPVPEFSRGAWEVLRKERWPGNVRQLAGVVENLVFRLNGDRTIGAAAVSRELGAEDGFASEIEKPGDRRRITRELLVRTLDSVEWNRALASEALGISPRTLRRRMQAFGLGRRKRKSGAAIVPGNGHGT